MLLTVFANDLAVRRTAIASSLGLVVTALVFFRSQPVSVDIPSDKNDLSF